jgi:beta-glucosidase
LAALKARAPTAIFKFRDGRYVTDAVQAAKDADVVIIFATQWMSEGMDVPDLHLPSGQDGLIEAVSTVNSNTIVVLETGGPVVMPWLEKTAAVVEAWYPGARGGEAITSVLYGDTNPSGHLPITFPTSVDQLPSPILPGSTTTERNPMGKPPGVSLSLDYDVDGSDVGYRWYARTGAKPLFPFGFGLSYTSFEHNGLKVAAAGKVVTASFTVRNIGNRPGADVPQLYLVAVNGQRKLRLAAFDKVALAAGASRKISVSVDPRLIADWENGGWSIAGGTYGFALGMSAEALGPVETVRIAAGKWGPQ